MENKQQAVITAFVSLTEKIANSKTNLLDFGSPEMTFYRGEIHLIKLIGDFPGIYAAELARKLGITRAVVQRTISILESRGLILKETDLNDKKRYRLFLSQPGQKAYQLHEAYHQEHDQQLFNYLAELSPQELTAINEFLNHATNLIDNHA